MARPLVFEYVIECDDPERAREDLLSVTPSPQALETLRRVEKLQRLVCQGEEGGGSDGTQLSS